MSTVGDSTAMPLKLGPSGATDVRGVVAPASRGLLSGEGAGRRSGGRASCTASEDASGGGGFGDSGGDRCMETRSSELGVTSAEAPGVCGLLLGVPALTGRPSDSAAGGSRSESALRGERSPPEPSEEGREGAAAARTFETDSGCDFHRYWDADLAGDLGRMSPVGRGGIWFAVTRPPRP
mmetsp:Transcript_106649/g.278406  ORF Transcript_106649/g.278406 Transcript_106649/m.278406 type:complete len:180 (-) Transcript_106649:62-601(-)